MPFVDPSDNLAWPTSSSLSTLTGSNAGFIALPENSTRRGATFFSPDSNTGKWYAQLGGIPTTSSWTVVIKPGWYYEVPFNFQGDIGVVSDVSGSASTLNVTELAF